MKLRHPNFLIDSISLAIILLGVVAFIVWVMYLLGTGQLT